MSIASLERATVEQIVRQIVVSQLSDSSRVDAPPKSNVDELVVSISARHCHLTDEHVEMLFGPGHTLTPMKDLY